MRSLDKMKKRVNYEGYNLHDNNLVKDKYKSFKASLKNAYQAEWIEFNGNRYRCLINPDKLKENYDQKEISIDFDSGIKNGSVFYWERTKSHWLVYLQDYSEEAYFRATIRRCDYEIDVNGHKYWIYLRGPVETALIWKQKHQIEVNELNYSILFYIEKNEETVKYFSRLNVIKFDGHNWRVAATDKYSQDGIIEVYLEEYFDNEMEDQSKPIEVIEPNVWQPHIEGPQIVRPYDNNLFYSVVGLQSGEFTVNSNKVKIDKLDNTSCLLEILTGKSGEFDLTFTSKKGAVTTLNIKIKSF